MTVHLTFYHDSMCTYEFITYGNPFVQVGGYSDSQQLTTFVFNRYNCSLCMEKDVFKGDIPLFK